MPSLYKIYVSILTERLKEEIERKEIVPENQTGFRKGKGTLDNIYIINYLINRQISEKKGKMVALFVDLKAAFDTVNREVLINTLRERGVRKELIDRVAQLGVETRSRVRIGKKRGGCFWNTRGVRQGCPISPLLFNILTADLEEKMSRIKGGEDDDRERKDLYLIIC